MLLLDGKWTVNNIFHFASDSVLFYATVDNTASILTRRRRYSRTIQDIYYLPILISDGGVPPLSSSSTLTVRVCACERDGRVRTCHAEAFLSSPGLSTGALIAILLCVVILLGKSFSVLSTAIFCWLSECDRAEIFNMRCFWTRSCLVVGGN